MKYLQASFVKLSPYPILKEFRVYPAKLLHT